MTIFFTSFRIPQPLWLVLVILQSRQGPADSNEMKEVRTLETECKIVFSKELQGIF
jgi:hypothetical protein